MSSRPDAVGGPVDRGTAAAPRAAPAAADAPAAPRTRLVYAAAHVVLRPSYRRLPHAPTRPGSPAQVAAHLDLGATMRLRRELDAAGFGIAEAMDTAQRFQLGWDAARTLIRATGELRLRHGFVAGAGTDHLPTVRGPADLVDGVVAQARFVASCGGIPIVLPMPWLPLHHARERDYVDVYTAIADRLDGPIFVHWLGPMFHEALAGYFPGDSFARVMAHDPATIRGCKLSLLDDAFEVRTRRELLARDQIVLTGDDLHFGRLLLGGNPNGDPNGDANGTPNAAPPAAPPPVQRWTTIGDQQVALGDFSHGLLGVFDAIAAPAGRALRALDATGDAAAFARAMAPCEALGQHLFAPPTQHYKAGLAFLAWLRGSQDNPMLVNRADRERDAAHLLRAAGLAFACGAVPRTPVAEARLQAFLDGRLHAPEDDR